ncbi:MAG: hypothetical protein Q4C20_13135 [Erysipelotrichaceae bacterium]|nr:hypothetical protein [Erysipelotrichaceae bacterium]
MRLIDRVRKSVLETPYVRSLKNADSAIQQYYDDLASALSINDFPLIYVDTVEKRTYTAECNNKFFLIFDDYLMDVIRQLNDIIINPFSANTIKNFFYRIVSEECFIQGKLSSALYFASLYLNNLDDVIKSYKNASPLQNSSTHLFIQQAFLIAHEIFHFYVNNNPSQTVKNLIAKEEFLRDLYKESEKSYPNAAADIKNQIQNKTLVEECLCDSTGILQALDVGQKIEEIDIVQAGLAIGMSIMCQFSLSTIRKRIKNPESFENDLGLFNFRLMHLKAITALHIDELTSQDDGNEYRVRIEDIYKQWMHNVELPILILLSDNSMYFENEPDLLKNSPDEVKRLTAVLQEIYKC